MEAHDVMKYYESLAATSADMLAAARAGDWDAVVAAEHRCATQIEALRASGDRRPTGEEERRRRVEIIRRLLADDAEIRELADPWLRRLEDVLRSAGNVRRVDRAYR
ncbi:MAG: flagellar protein FliT [Burkholderiales bacterium]|nr:flagellar protein FliT [Burkholderiales bacterium]